MFTMVQLRGWGAGENKQQQQNPHQNRLGGKQYSKEKKGEWGSNYLALVLSNNEINEI